MKKRTFQQTAALTAALMICMSAVISCGDKDKTKKPETADKLLSNSYKSVELNAPDGIESVDQMVYVKAEEKVILTCHDKDYNPVFYSTDLEFTDYTKIEFELELNEDANNSYELFPMDDGCFCALVTSTTHGDISEPDWDDPEFDFESFDYEAYEAAAESTYKICKFDNEGKLVSDNPVTDIDKYCSGDYNYLTNVVYCGDDTIFMGIGGDEDVYVTLDCDGTIGEKFDFSDANYINYVGRDAEGNVVCTVYGNDGEEIRSIDLEKRSFGDTKVKMESNGLYVYGPMVSGTGDYKMYLPMNSGLYGLKNDDTLEEIVNWIDSDINSNYIRSVMGLDNGDFVVFEQNWDTNEIKLSRITKRDVSELEDTVVVTIGMMWSDQEVTSKITEFNKSNDKYRIKIKDYSEFDVWNEEKEKYDSTAEGQLKNDIISGNAPDFICVYNRSVIDSLASKGVFADLYSFMENDSDISKDKFLPNILTALETDGKLFSLSPSFGIQTFAAKTNNIPADKQDWTMDDMIEAYNNLPDGTVMFKDANSKLNTFNLLCTSMVSEFVDYDNKSCSFNSPEFIKFLEFCNNFPDEENEPDWENMSQDEQNAYWADQEMMCINDKALLEVIYMSSLREYGKIKNVDFGEDVTLVGLPSSDGNGGMISFYHNFAILSDSGSKDVAWSFIKEFFTDEDQGVIMPKSGNMPVLAEAFEAAADECMSKPYFIDENGEKVEYDDRWYIGDHEIIVDPLTQEERDFMVDYVKNITRTAAGYDTGIQEICTEEVQAYFAGEKTAEDAANMIQNRVSILISEQN